MSGMTETMDNGTTPEVPTTLGEAKFANGSRSKDFKTSEKSFIIEVNNVNHFNFSVVLTRRNRSEGR